MDLADMLDARVYDERLSRTMQKTEYPMVIRFPFIPIIHKWGAHVPMAELTKYSL